VPLSGFRTPILDALQAFSDERNAHQLCQLARHFAETGDETFRKRLYEIVEQKPFKDLPWVGEEELLALDGETAFVFAARLLGQELLTREWECNDDHLIEFAIERFGEDHVNQVLSDSSDEALGRFQRGWLEELKRRAERIPAPSRRETVRATTVGEIISAAHSDNARHRISRFRAWGMYADEADVETVLQHLWATESSHALANLLSVFGNRALPEFDARLIEFCQHENAEVRRRAFGAMAKNTHPLIRSFALKQLESGVSNGAVISLFASNFEPGDEQRILEALELSPDEGDRHSLLMDINRLLERNPEADCSQLAVIVYASTPCENCRFFALRLLHSREVVPEWLREECCYDSGKDCRQLVSSSATTTKTYLLALPNGQRVLLNGDRVLIGRLPYDQEKQQTLGDLLGQEPRCEGEWIYLSDLCVSRKHAMLTRSDDGRYAIEDTQSRSGTFVNDLAIRERTLLKVGDTIRIGQSTIGFFDETTQGLNHQGTSWVGLAARLGEIYLSKAKQLDQLSRAACTCPTADCQFH